MRNLLLATLLFALPAQAQLFITEVAWMGSDSAFQDEWIEIHNPGAAPIDLAGFELVEGNAVRALPSAVIAPGGYLVLEDRDEATSLVAPDALLFDAIGLSNTGETLRLCPAGQTDNLAVCDIANADNPWPAGDNNVPKATMSRVGPLTLGVAGTFIDHDGPDSAATDSGGIPIHGSPGAPTPEDPEPPQDAGPDPVEDAGPPPEVGPLHITEVAWMGSVSSANDEWIEVFNPNAFDVDLAAFELVEGTTVRPLPSAVVPAGGFLLVEKSAGATTLEGAVLAFTLSNTGEALRLCPAGETDVLANCDIAHEGGAWPAGSNSGQKATMSRTGDPVLGVAGTFVDHSGEVSAVTDSGGQPIFGSPGAANPVEVDPPGPDAGPDLGPNAAPSISVSAPAAATSERDVRVEWSASDPDEGDALEVSLFYDTDSAGNDGVRIARGLPASGSFDWSTVGVPPGSYFVFGRVTDRRGATGYAYAGGQVTVAGGAELVDFQILEPDGVNDVDADGNVLVTWSLDLPDDAQGTISLFFDTDEEGFDGEPIAAGIPVRNGDGTLAPTEYLWETEGVPLGTYAVYGVLDWSRGVERDYGEFVSVGEVRGCGQAGAGGAAIGLLAIALALRRRR